jgi:hypothetical protein
VPAGPTASSAARGRRPLHALANDNQVDVLDCGSGDDVAWLNRNDPRDRTINCETVKIVVPTTE